MRQIICPSRSLPKRKTSAAQRPRTFAVKTGAWRGTGPRPTVQRRGSDSHEIKRTLRSYRPKETFGAIKTSNLANRENLGNPAHIQRGTGTRTTEIPERIETRRSLLRGHRWHRDRDGAPTDL